MASLRRLRNSPFWIACFVLPDGRPTQRSTKSKNRGEAWRIALALEDAARDARAGRLTEAQARKNIAYVYYLTNGEPLPCSQIDDYFESWLKLKSVEAGTKSHQRYSDVVKQFMKFLGPKARQDLVHLRSRDVLAFREELSARVSSSTTNVALKVIRAALNQAVRDKLVTVNEANNVSLVPHEKFERRAFTIDEIKKVIAVADAEWTGMIYVGLYCGLRLGDIAMLRWNNVSLEREEISVTTKKTKRHVIVPLAQPLLRILQQRPKPHSGPVFPRAYATYDKSMLDGALSHEFFRVLVKAGLVKARTHDSTGKGRSARRQQNELSFHCLRHSTTSLLRNAGVGSAITMDIVGHDSQTAHKLYTHVDTASKRTAINLLPDIAA